MKMVTLEQILGIVRLAMGLLSGVMVARGKGDATDWNTLTGAVLTIVTAGWSAFSNRPSKMADSTSASGLPKVLK